MIIAQSPPILVGADYHTLVAMAMVGIVTSLAGLIAAVTSIIQAQAAKIRSDIAASESAHARELSCRNSEQLGRVEKQTDGRLSELTNAKDALREELTAVQKELATLQGRDAERKESAS